MPTPTYTYTPIILTRSSDWVHWIEQVKTEAQCYGIWDQINPYLPVQGTHVEKPIRVSPTNIKERRPKVLKKRTQTTYSNVASSIEQDDSMNPEGVHTNIRTTHTVEFEEEVDDISPLTKDERVTLRYETSVYEEQNREYETERKSLAEIRREIQQSVILINRHVTYMDAHPYFIMRRLKQIYAPSKFATTSDSTPRKVLRKSTDGL